MLGQECMVGMFATVSIQQLEWSKSHTMIEIIFLNLILTRPFNFVNHWVGWVNEPEWERRKKMELGAGNRIFT